MLPAFPDSVRPVEDPGALGKITPQFATTSGQGCPILSGESDMIGWLLSLPYRFVASFGWPGLAAGICAVSARLQDAQAIGQAAPGRSDHRLGGYGRLVVPANVLVPTGQRRLSGGDGQSRHQESGKQQPHRQTQAQALPAPPVEWNPSSLRSPS